MSLAAIERDLMAAEYQLDSTVSHVRRKHCEDIRPIALAVRFVERFIGASLRPLRPPALRPLPTAGGGRATHRARRTPADERAASRGPQLSRVSNRGVRWNTVAVPPELQGRRPAAGSRRGAPSLGASSRASWPARPSAGAGPTHGVARLRAAGASGTLRHLMLALRSDSPARHLRFLGAPPAAALR